MKTRPFFQMFLSLLLVVLSSGYGMCSMDEESYRVTVRLFPDSKQLEGRASLPVSSNPAHQPVQLFHLSEQSVLLDLTFDGKPVAYSFSDGLLKVELPGQSDPFQGNLTIHYRTRYADPLPESTVGMENPSFGVSATIGEYGAYLSSGTAWFPEPQNSPETYRFRIEGPEGFYGVTSGKLIEYGREAGRSHIVWEATKPLSGFALSAGYYQIFEDLVGDIQVLAFLSKENASLASVYIDPTKKYLQFYQCLLGPYPYAKFAIVENFLPTGYGLPSWTLLGSNVISLPFIPNTSLPHEIVHSWFGNAVEVDYQNGNWAEGLTSYLADYLLNEQRSDELGREHRLKLLRDYAALVEPQLDYPLTSFVSRSSKPDQAIGYGKSAMIFHMLRRELGEEKFWSSLRRLTSEGRGKRLGWRELRDHFNASAAKDLSAFFRQWIEQSGAPRLRFADVSVRNVADGWEVRGLVEQSEPAYDLNLPLQLKTEAGTIEQSLTLRQRQTPFVFSSDVPVVQLTGDPEAHLFRRLHVAELPSTINDLRASRNLVVVVPAEQSPLLEASNDLLRGLQKQDAPIISWQDFTFAQHPDEDLLFIGWPPPEVFDLNRLVSQAATGESFEWGGVTYNDAADSLFLTRKLHSPTQQLVAVFHPLSTAAARKVARKIPHYGRYGHLVFRDDANVVKGTEEPSGSALQIDLNGR